MEAAGCWMQELELSFCLWSTRAMLGPDRSQQREAPGSPVQPPRLKLVQMSPVVPVPEPVPLTRMDLGAGP